MNILYSDILPLNLNENQESIISCFHRLNNQSNQIDIAVGYVSKYSLEELDRIISEKNEIKICLIIGMYFIDGISESLYNTAMYIHKKWQDNNIGEIRAVFPMKYHGKVYCFYKDNVPFGAIIGSANMSILKPDASNLHQYEIAAVTELPSECEEISSFINSLKSDRCSLPIDKVNLKKYHEQNTSLEGIDLVQKVTESDRKIFCAKTTDTSFILPIKTPSYEDRFLDDTKHYTKSNINVCYAAPRNRRKARDWYETQLTVSKEIRNTAGYPQKNIPFFVITDDGYMFKAHTTSDSNKQFSAVGDELILGRWLKGRLAVAGLATPVNNTQQDVDRKGMITTEMLHEYGANSLLLTKTTGRIQDEQGNELDVWLLDFIAQ